MLRSALYQVIPGLDDDQLTAAYQATGDPGPAIRLLFPATTSEDPTLAEVRTAFDTIAGARVPGLKTALLAALLRRSTPRGADYIARLVAGELRIGAIAGLIEEAVAVATDTPLAAVRRAMMLNGDLGAVAVAARRGQLDAIVSVLFHPIRSMLASPVASADEAVNRLGLPLWVEDKYDGIRCQVHVDDGRVRLFSRDHKVIDAQFPEIVEAAAGLDGPLIVDAELLAWRDGRALPFATLQRRIGRVNPSAAMRQDVPIACQVFDILTGADGSVIDEPLEARRARLEAIEWPQRFQLSPLRRVESADDLDAAFVAARARGNEGLMVKDPASTYQPGRRGFSWLKVKRALDPLDVLVVGVEWGHGKRRAVLSDYTFAVRDTATGGLVTLGKAYSGLTDAEIATMTEHFEATTLQEFGRYRTVQPDTVLEIAFEAIMRSRRHASGFALRFPRILRLRPDKPASDISTLADVELAWQALQAEGRTS